MTLVHIVYTTEYCNGNILKDDYKYYLFSSGQNAKPTNWQCPLTVNDIFCVTTDKELY